MTPDDTSVSAAQHEIEWVQMWHCTCGTVGSTESQERTHRRLHESKERDPDA